ncbi:OmpL47-type beta-barrel domain-containing protein [Nocardioides sp. URHA0032]|uniref:OmpL47-type beta-barrel domain-containing protein n=1 Tax=Nocardioides sp. URHA0032 TaxID=1380388 RepID=UPI000AC1BD74|nr:AGE family epimerase/isomerase [Nocardioides sp. URHA0032]
MLPIAPRRATRLTALVGSAVLAVGLVGRAPAAAAAVDPEVPPVLAGDTWLQHHRDDLMPYWLVPDALGEPLGNFPSFRGPDGELLPDQPDRGTSTLGRGVFGYSLAFLLTGQERFLTYARAGIAWIEAHAEDHVHGGYFGELDAAGRPVDPLANKDVFDAASVGLGYAMYFAVTHDPAAEAKLLAVRDLVFGPYYDAAGQRIKDSLTYDLATEVDTGGMGAGNGGDITNYLVPGTAFLLPSIGILSDPARNDQFRADLRVVTQALIDRHKNSAAAAANRWMFWGRTGRFGTFNAPETDFGHNIQSYAMIHLANQLFADRPWSGLATDRSRMLDRAWDDGAGRWNERLRSFQAGNVEPDSQWWSHDEADQLLAALDLTDGFTNTDRLARSAQTFLDVYVDHTSPVRETFARVSRNEADNDLRKSFFGKNMLHNMEHALVLYLHGRALEGRPARLHFALPHDQALTAETRPYWFDATGQERKDLGPLAALPGHDLVTVDFTGIGQVPRPPYPPPDDTTPPTTVVSVDPGPNAAGWHRSDVTAGLTATDDLVGVKEIRARHDDTSFIRPGGATTTTLTDEGVHDVTFHAVDLLGNAEADRTVRIRIDRTPPALDGLPAAGCRLWPPNHRYVEIADVRATDALSGLADLDVDASSSDGGFLDVIVVGGRVLARAELGHRGAERIYTVEATATDDAGNTASDTGTCTVSRPSAGR